MAFEVGTLDEVIHARNHLRKMGANIVFEDANIDAAVNGSAFAIFLNQGQACIAGSRLMLHEKIADRFLDHFLKLAASIRLGDPLDPTTGIFDVAFGGGGADTIKGSNDADTIFGGAGNDTIKTRGGDDLVNGGSGDDVIYGGGGDDLLKGLGGSDQTWGGKGNSDRCSGEVQDSCEYALA